MQFEELDFTDEMEELALTDNTLTPETSVISAYKKLLEMGLDFLLSDHSEYMFSWGKFVISLKIDDKRTYDYYDIQVDDDSLSENKKFLIMDVEFYGDNQKLGAYRDFDDNDNDYLNFYNYYRDDNYDYVNDNSYYQEKAREIEYFRHAASKKRYFICQLPIFSDETLNDTFYERLMKRVQFFFDNLIDRDMKELDFAKNNTCINYYGKINYNELIKFRDEELARINARLLEFGKSR